MHGAGPWPQAPAAVSMSICCQKVPCSTRCGRGAGAETTPSLGRGLSAWGGSSVPREGLTRRGTCLSRSGNLTTRSALPAQSTATVASICKRAGGSAPLPPNLWGVMWDRGDPTHLAQPHAQRGGEPAGREQTSAGAPTLGGQQPRTPHCVHREGGSSGPPAPKAAEPITTGGTAQPYGASLWGRGHP